MLKKILTALLAVVSLITASVLIATPAQAAGSIIEREMFLAARAGEYGGTAKILSTDRRIFLAADDYLWTHEFNDYSYGSDYYKERRITLAEGYYNWNCISFPDSVEFYAYRTRCTLRREATGVISYLADMLVWPDDTYRYNDMLGSNYHWYSTLTRV
ncbi:hypothetical protein [Micromonospora globbae]|uniref:hypothetical protein n=1 Tax=Micromonospora globbae TaxID=1894969 RepID=UPI0034487024